MSRGGGGFSGGYSRSPSMSRSAPSYSRPSTSRPSYSTRPSSPQFQNRSSVGRQAVTRPSTSPINRGGASPGINRPSTARPGASSSLGMRTPPSGRGAFQSPRSFQQPSRGQLDSFLNGGTAAAAGGFAAGAAGGLAAGARSSGPIAGQGGEPRTFETARGGTITVGGGSGSIAG